MHIIKGFSLWSPTELTAGLTVLPGPQLRFISQSMQNADFFLFLDNVLMDYLWYVKELKVVFNSVYVKKQFIIWDLVMSYCFFRSLYMCIIRDCFQILFLVFPEFGEINFLTWVNWLLFLTEIMISVEQELICLKLLDLTATNQKCN